MSKNKGASSAVALIIFGCIIAILVATTVIINILNKIPENDPTLSGNTGGNLNNGGYFCEDKGVVYFANPYDSGSLYSMNPDQTEIKKLTTGNCRYINAGGDYLYYAMSTPEGGTGLGFIIKTSGIYRCKKNGARVECLSEDNTLISSLVGNYVYYQASTGKGTGLKKVAIDGKEKASVVEDSFVLNPACSESGYIFFGGTTTNHYLYQLSTGSDSVSALWDGDVWNPVYDGGYFYYMDISDKYSICRYSPTGQSVEILTHDRADSFNVGYGFVYYVVSVGDNPGLYRMHTDGSNVELVASGYISDVNMTSTYTYYREYGTTTPIYCVPTTGINSPGYFQAAELAAQKENK